jgi:hypothetical protein
MKFGLIKSGIENKLLKSYQNNKLSEELKVFKKIVLENKKIRSLYYIYDELSSKKGFSSKDIANEFINECIKIYENNINKISKKELDLINSWIGNTNIENNYEVVDNLLTTNLLKLESKIESRKQIVESLLSKETNTKSEINLPLKTLVNVANTTINKYISSLDENTQKELTSLIKGDEKELEKKYFTTKDEVLSKLSNLMSESDSETKVKIEESISKIKSEKFDKINLFRLTSLNENI